MESPLQCGETLEDSSYRLYMYELGGDQCHDLGSCSFQGGTFFFEQGSGIFLQPSDLACGNMVLTVSFLIQDSEYCIHSTPTITFQPLCQLQTPDTFMDFSCGDLYLFRFYCCQNPATQQLQYALSEGWMQTNGSAVSITVSTLQQLHKEYRQHELELQATEQLLIDIRTQVGLKRKRLEHTKQLLRNAGCIVQKISHSHIAGWQPHDNSSSSSSLVATPSWE